MASKGSKKAKKEDVVEEQVADSKNVVAEEAENEMTDQVEEATEEEVVDAPEVNEEENKISELTTKVSELNDRYLRLSAEYDNYRKRTLKERMELTKSAGEGLLRSLLPVVDDFDRAISHLDDASDLKAVKEGIDLINSKFQAFLKQNGVVEIDTKEKDFDTDLHEAITKIPAPDDSMKGKVIDCIEKGYMLSDKVMRFAKVVVGE